MSWQRSLLIAAIVLFAVVYYGLAAVALRDLYRRPVVQGINRTGWALAILCLPILGAVLYGSFGIASLPNRGVGPVEPEFTPFDHLFDDDELWPGSSP